MKILISVLLTIPLSAQTISNGTIYQSWIASGQSYITPLEGNQILNKKAGANWKTLTTTAVSSGTVGTIVAGLEGIISISPAGLAAMVLGNQAWNQFAGPLLDKEAPNPSEITSNVLMLNQSLTVAPGICGSGYIYAIYNRKLHAVGPITVDGLSVTYSPQGVAALRNAAGYIKSLAVVHVLVCHKEESLVTEDFRLPDDINVDALRKVLDAHEAENRARELREDTERIEPCAFDSCREMLARLGQ